MHLAAQLLNEPPKKTNSQTQPAAVDWNALVKLLKFDCFIFFYIVYILFHNYSCFLMFMFYVNYISYMSSIYLEHCERAYGRCQGLTRPRSMWYLPGQGVKIVEVQPHISVQSGHTQNHRKPMKTIESYHDWYPCVYIYKHISMKIVKAISSSTSCIDCMELKRSWDVYIVQST